MNRPVRIGVFELAGFIFCEMFYYISRFKLHIDDLDSINNKEKGKKSHSHLFNEFYRKASDLETVVTAVDKTSIHKISWNKRVLQLKLMSDEYELT